MRKNQPNVLTLILDAQKTFLYPEKSQVVVFPLYFIVKVRDTLFMDRNRIQKKTDVYPLGSHCALLLHPPLYNAKYFFP